MEKMIHWTEMKDGDFYFINNRDIACSKDAVLEFAADCYGGDDFDSLEVCVAVPVKCDWNLRTILDFAESACEPYDEDWAADAYRLFSPEEEETINQILARVFTENPLYYVPGERIDFESFQPENLGG